MQDRYVGDVGDFAKYALLRRLAGKNGELRIHLGIVWCLYPDETHNKDGRHVSYLSRREFENLDDRLLAALRRIVASGKRSISSVAQGKLLPRSTMFCELALAPKVNGSSREHRLSHRRTWLENCLADTEKCDLIFFDPDNGIEVESVPKHHVKSGKYIYWDELDAFWQRGQNLLVYHHLNRTMPSVRQVRILRERFESALEGARALPLVFRRGSCRVFWLVYRPSVLGKEMERRARDFLDGGWSKHFSPVSDFDGNQTEARSTV